MNSYSFPGFMYYGAIEVHTTFYGWTFIFKMATKSDFRVQTHESIEFLSSNKDFSKLIAVGTRGNPFL